MNKKSEENLHWRKKSRFRQKYTSKGYLVHPVYYRMNPDMDPERTEKGKVWHRETKSSQSERSFNQEYELDFEAVQGGLIYPGWNKRINVLITYVRLHPDWSFQCVIDPGTSVTAAIWQCIVPRYRDSNNVLTGGWVIKFDEYYVGDGVPHSESLSASKHAEAIMRISQVHCDRIVGRTKGGKSLKGAQGWLDTTLMDPSAWRREQSHEDLGSLALRYDQAGMASLEPAPTSDVPGGIERVKQLDERTQGFLHPNGLVDDTKEGFPIAYSVPHMTWYCKEKKAYKMDSRGKKVLKTNDHLMDCERMGGVYASESHTIKTLKPFSAMGKRLMISMNPKTKKGGGRGSVKGQQKERPSY